jgi:anti-sigma factor RsiW
VRSVTDDHEALREDIAPYALEALDEPTRARVGAHVVGCPECSERFREYRAVLGLIPYALAAEAPPSRARTALLERARGTAGGALSWRRRVAARPARGRRLRWLTPVGWAAAATIIAGLLGWNVSLQRRVVTLAPAVDVEGLARLPAGPVVELIGTGLPQASARLLVAADGQRGALAVTGLRPLPPDRVYQLWFARPGEKPVTGGPFRVNPHGEALAAVTIPLPLAEVRAIAVTEEAAPRSLTPTGKHLLDLRPR